MTIYFRASCKAIQTEYRHIEAPPNWEEMSKADRLVWLGDNIDSSHFHSGAPPRRGAHGARLQGLLAAYIPNSTAAGVSGAGAALGSGSGSTTGSGAGS